MELWVLPGWENKDYFLSSLHGIPKESEKGKNEQEQFSPVQQKLQDMWEGLGLVAWKGKALC